MEAVVDPIGVVPEHLVLTDRVGQLRVPPVDGGVVLQHPRLADVRHHAGVEVGPDALLGQLRGADHGRHDPHGGEVAADPTALGPDPFDGLGHGLGGEERLEVDAVEQRGGGHPAGLRAAEHDRGVVDTKKRNGSGLCRHVLHARAVLRGNPVLPATRAELRRDPLVVGVHIRKPE